MALPYSFIPALTGFTASLPLALSDPRRRFFRKFRGMATGWPKNLGLPAMPRRASRRWRPSNTAHGIKSGLASIRWRRAWSRRMRTRAAASPFGRRLESALAVLIPRPDGSCSVARRAGASMKAPESRGATPPAGRSPARPARRKPAIRSLRRRIGLRRLPRAAGASTGQTGAVGWRRPPDKLAVGGWAAKSPFGRHSSREVHTSTKPASPMCRT